MEGKVSVVIPTYNRANLVINAIESALGQTFRDLEVVVVDDGSTDGTGEILRHEYGERIRYFYQPNQGQSAARNRGLGEARGEWVAFLDSDDVWLPEKLQYQLQALELFRGRCEACFTDVDFAGSSELTSTVFHLRGEEGRDLMGMVADPVRLMLDRQRMPPVWLPSVVVRRDLARRVGGFDPKIRGVGEDEEFLFRLARETGFCFVNKPLLVADRSPVAQRHAGPSALWDQADFQLAQTQYRFEKQLRLSEGMPPYVQRLIRKELALLHSAWANWHLRKGNTPRAREAMSISLGYGFSPILAVKRILVSADPKLALRLVALNAVRKSKENHIVPTSSPSATRGGLLAWHVPAFVRNLLPAAALDRIRRVRVGLLSRHLPRHAEFAQSREEVEASAGMSVIVPIRDAPEVTRRCLGSLEKYATQAQIVLVDDGSVLPATLAMVAEFSVRNGWEVVRHEQSHGHSQACAAGARLAARPYLCLLNSDTVVTPWCWRGPKELFEIEPNIGVAGPSTSLSPTAQALPLANYCRHYWTDSEIWGFASVTTGNCPEPVWVELPWVSGCALFIRRGLWEELGGFDPHLPDYGNEVELCKRVSKMGYRSVWVRNSYIHHFGQQSYGTLRERSIFSRILAAKRYIARKHGAEGK